MNTMENGNKYHPIIEEYLNNYVKFLTNGGLLNELLEFNPGTDFTGRRAHRIYSKCLRNNHPTIAAKIKEKYGHRFPKPEQHDIVMASMMCELAQQNKTLGTERIRHNMEQVPSTGRIVRYVTNEGVIKSAIICRVWDDSSSALVNLRVIEDDPGPFPHATSVPKNTAEEGVQANNTWDWPPRN
jgi:hypothetical protein